MFDPNPEIKVLKTCFWTHHRVGEDETNPLVKPRRRTDVLHALTRRHQDCPRAPTRRTHHTLLLRLTTCNWTGLTRHVISQSTATSALLHSHPPRHHTSQQSMSAHATASIIMYTFATSSRWARIAYVDDMSSYWVFIQCAADTISPDTRLHLHRRWPKSLIDKIWAIQNPIWVISVSFPTFLAIPDTSVRSDSADSNLKIIKNGRWNKSCWNWKFWWDRFWLLKNANWRLSIWEETSSSSVGEQTREYARRRLVTSW